MLITTLYFSNIKGAVAEEFMSFKSIGAFLMAFAVMDFCTNLFKNKEYSKTTKACLKLLSKCTFGVYLVHELILSLSSGMDLFVPEKVPVIGIPLEAIIIFVISFAVVRFINLTPIGKYIS